MPADANAALAAAAARIADLEAQLAATQASSVKTQAALDDAAAAQARAAEAIAALNAQTEQMQQAEIRATKAEDDLRSLALKFDQLYGPVEQGIVRGPAPYITPDNVSHSTLHDALIHLLEVEADVTLRQAQHLADNAAAVVPLINRVSRGASLPVEKLSE